MIAHPSTFVIKATYAKFGVFSMDYEICADYDLMLRLAEKKEINFIPLMEVIANFSTGGTSSGMECQVETNEIR